MSFLTRGDIARMRESLTEDSGDSLMRKQKKEMLRTRSLERIQNWPNTLEALRRKKEMFVKDRAEKEELERQEVDRQEAELRRKQRLQTIERANDMLFRQSDKMKMLKSQMAYADAIHTRKFQVAEKEALKRKVIEEDEMFHRIKMEKVRQGELEEKEKIAKREAKIAEIKVSRKEQLDEVFARRKAEKDEFEAIGVAMRKRAQEQMEEEIQAQEAKQKVAAKANADLMVANEKFKKIRDSVRAREKLEEEEREKQVEGIERRKQAQKDLAARRFEAKQAQRQKIIDTAIELLAKKANTEEAVAKKQEAEARAKSDGLEAAKEAKRAKLWSDIVASRTEMVQRHLDDFLAEKEDEKLMSANWRQLTEEAENKRVAELKEKHAQTLKIKSIQKAEAIAAARKRVSDKLAEREEANLLMMGNNSEEQKFQDECRDQIAKYSAAGKNVYPLLRALEMQMPPLLPAIKNKRPPKKEED